MSVSAQEIDQRGAKFVIKFCKVVAAHKESRVIKCLDKKYRTDQLEFLGGNKTQFVNELFSGNEIQTGEFVNLKLEEIDAIEIVEMEALEYMAWIYVFHIKAGDHTIELWLELKKHGRKYGFVGAVG